MTKSDLVRTANAWALGNAKLGSRGKVDWLPGFLFKWSICDTQHNTSDYCINYTSLNMFYAVWDNEDIRLRPGQSIAAVLMTAIVYALQKGSRERSPRSFRLVALTS